MSVWTGKTTGELLRDVAALMADDNKCHSGIKLSTVWNLPDSIKAYNQRLAENAAQLGKIGRVLMERGWTHSRLITMLFRLAEVADEEYAAAEAASHRPEKWER